MGEDKKSRRGERSSKSVHSKLKERKVRKKEDSDDLQKFGQIISEDDHGRDYMRKTKLNKADNEKKRSKMMLKKKRKKEKEKVHFNTVDELSRMDDGSSKKLKSGNVVGSDDAKTSCQSEAQTKIDNSIGSSELLVEKDKYKKTGKSKRKDRITSKKAWELVKCKTEAVESENIYHLSSVDDDCSKGMKKWITEYHKSRPGLEILQQRIDEFIISHEAQEEKARKEREAQAAEEGWTVVGHHKGKKRTTDSASGISVGSVAQAAVVDRMEKKKKKEIALNFYNFQKREAQRSEVMMLQSKFEQDKKRIQQMRAARKFRPY